MGQAQARPYRPVNGFLNVMLKGGQNKERALRLWRIVGPDQDGLIARVKQVLNNLNIHSDLTENGPQTIGAETIKDDAKHKILHAVRDRLRRMAWRRAEMRSQNMQGLEDLDYKQSTMLWRWKKLDNHIQRLLEIVLSNAVWTRERVFRHTNGRLASSPKCTFCDTDEDETLEHLYWNCPRWGDIRQNFPLARIIFEKTQHSITKRCGLVLRSEDHSDSQVINMQNMMATILQARYAAGKIEASSYDLGIQSTDPEEQIPEPGDASRIPHDPEERVAVSVEGAPGQNNNARIPHDLEIVSATNGEEAFRCTKCGTFRRGSTWQLTQEYCDGRRRIH